MFNTGDREPWEACHLRTDIQFSVSLIKIWDILAVQYINGVNTIVFCLLA